MIIHLSTPHILICGALQADSNLLRRIELASAVVSTITGPPPTWTGSPPFYTDGQGTSASFFNLGSIALNSAGTDAIIVSC